MPEDSTTPPAVMSVDVEEYFQVEAFSDVIDRSRWDHLESRVESGTQRLLDLFDGSGATATFFVVGWVAERHPELLRTIVGRGHEVACHSYSHRPVYALTPDEFLEDTRTAKDRIEQAIGATVSGYRAPTFSITSASLWALAILAALGFQYDSSVFPIHHDRYGIPSASRAPFVVRTGAGNLLECPISTFRLGVGPNLPVGGGGYLRLLPLWYTRLGIDRLAAERLPLIMYVHPWELDSGQPRVSVPFWSRVRHYTNLSRTEHRLRTLLQLRSFTSFERSALMDTTQWERATELVTAAV